MFTIDGPMVGRLLVYAQQQRLPTALVSEIGDTQLRAFFDQCNALLHVQHLGTARTAYVEVEPPTIIWLIKISPRPSSEEGGPTFAQHASTSMMVSRCWPKFN